MVNLLRETMTEILGSGHQVSDIQYIGSRDGYSCTWAEFEKLANVEYDDGFGGAVVAWDLEIVFADGGVLSRGEYDGSEWWSYTAPFVMPTEQTPIKHLTRVDTCYESLSAIHKAWDES